MKKNIKDTVEIVKMENPFEIEREEYSRDSIDKVMGKLNNALFEYEKEYKSEPILILISRELEIFFRQIMYLDTYHQMLGNDKKPIYTFIIFGVNCITTPRLKGLTFEIY